MEINIEPGKKSPVITLALFVWKYFTFVLLGLFTLPMQMWGYNKTPISHRLVGKRSYFSSDGAAIIARPDQKHPGRFALYAIVIEKNDHRAEFITHAYNDRRYPFKIIRHRNFWHVSVDGRSVVLECSTPIFTYNLLPKLSDKMKIDKPVKIKIDD